MLDKSPNVLPNSWHYKMHSSKLVKIFSSIDDTAVPSLRKLCSLYPTVTRKRRWRYILNESVSA